MEIKFRLLKKLIKIVGCLKLAALILVPSCGGSFTFAIKPSAPTSLSLVTPGTSPGLDSTPTISVSGVVSGDIVHLFIDSNCTT